MPAARAVKRSPGGVAARGPTGGGYVLGHVSVSRGLGGARTRGRNVIRLSPSDRHPDIILGHLVNIICQPRMELAERSQKHTYFGWYCGWSQAVLTF